MPITVSSRLTQWPLAVVALCVAGCGRDVAPPDPSARLAIDVRPLMLDGVGDAEWTLTVRNADNAIVWTKSNVSSRQFGDGAGSLTYVGTCDASRNPNRVSLVLERLLRDSGSEIPPDSYVNPSVPNPLERAVTCEENADTEVTFDVVIARDANQGFFDIAVDFADVFCSAKLDCQDALLHDASGARGPTLVMAFACTSGSDEPTHLYLGDVELRCGAETYPIDTSTRGQHGAALPHVFQSATYIGNETLPSYDKCYWNTAIGLDLAALADAPCFLHARGTAAPTFFADGHTPADTIWPQIVWDDVPVTTSAGALACGSHPLDGPGSRVRTVYTGFDGAAFDYALTCASGNVADFRAPVTTTTCAGNVAGLGQASVEAGAGGFVVTIDGARSVPYLLAADQSFDGCCAHPCCTSTP